MTEEEIPRIPRSRMPWLLLALGTGAAVLVWASTGIWKSNPEEFAEDIKATYAACEGNEIRLLAAKHNLQLVFEPCGSNNFLHYQWSPNGLELYYQTNAGPWLLNGDTGEHRALPVGFPIANAVWFNDDLIAFPEKGVKSYNIDVYDVRKNIINITGVKQVAPDTLVRGAAVDEVLFLAADREPELTVQDDSPERSVYRLFANTGRIEPAFPWLTEPVEDFTYNAHVDLVAYTTATSGGVIVAEGASGTQRHAFPGTKRASVSADGRFIAVEGLGDAIPIFHQKTEEDVDPDAEPTEAQPMDVPDYMPTEVQPPTIWIVDTRDGNQVQLPDVFGYNFQWYEATPYYCSFVLWGMENKEFNRNVVLTDVTPILKSLGIEIDMAAVLGAGAEE